VFNHVHLESEVLPVDRRAFTYSGTPHNYLSDYECLFRDSRYAEVRAKTSGQRIEKCMRVGCTIPIPAWFALARAITTRPRTLDG